ncbi:hypothetical protein [Campylobacter sp. CCS1377]|uniref:Uncharacterized protein n=1 Tax=Campylobacter sp. CCS1377 TaxID=3158229 RepID=A0AAU7E5Z8_9BACT|nr:hypothetical protein [Campylobacter jejuni]
MCILCGEMITKFHWSDVQFKEEKSFISLGENQKERMRLRLKKVKFLNIILNFYGLKLKEWQGSKYILSNQKGRDIIVNDLGDLWIKANELEKRPFDALDEKLLFHLRTYNG